MRLYTQGAHMEVTIWDDNAARIQRMEGVVHKAARALKLKLLVNSNCEPPLLARNGLYGKTPALQVGDHFWSKTPPRELTQHEVEGLLRKLFCAQE